MNFVLNKEYVEDNELLYRGVIFNPNFWDIDQNKPTSAIFKDSKGVSVDRDGNRSEEIVVDTLRSNLRLRAVVRISALRCRDLETHPIPKEIPSNIFHAEIHESESKIDISSGKAKRLRDNSVIVYFNNNPENF